MPCPGTSVTIQNSVRSKDLSTIGVIREEENGDGGTSLSK